MKNIIKKVTIMLLACLSFVVSAGCSKDNKTKKGELSFYSYDSNDKEINKNLFYVNSSMEWGADPSLLYVEDGEYGGYFYIYATSGYINTSGINVWRSKNLTDWECMGPAFMPDQDTNWAYKGFWAPQCIYDKEFGKYYLFYSAPWGSNGVLRYDSCAVSDNPLGPFEEITSEHKTAKEPLLIFELHQDKYDKNLISPAIGYFGISGFIKAIGPSPFIDPETGKRYLFFVADLGTANNENTSGAYCLEMEDWATPKYETLTRITRYGYTTIDQAEKVAEGGNTNEGPMCFYKDGKYHLIFLTFTYYNTKYQTRGALSDKPMGPYTKFQVDDGAQVIYTEFHFQRQSAGIHGLAYAGEQLFGAYMTFMNNVNYDDLRKFAIDEIVYVENSDGQLVMQANGPSVTPQPLPESLSGYRNMAKQAVVTSDNTANSDVKFLTDGVIPYHENSLSEEYKAFSGTTTLTFEFEDYVTLRSVLVYNSREYDYMFNQVDEITFEYRKNGETGTVAFGPVKYNWDYYNFEENKPAIGSAIIAEFDELDVKKVTMKITCPEGSSKIAIPEIILLGKDSDGSSTTKGEEKGALYEEYVFENEPASGKDWRNAESEMTIDAVLDDVYGDPVYRIYKNNDETADTFADLYVYKGNDGVYAFVDVHDSNIFYDPKKVVSANSNVILAMAKYGTGIINKNTVAFRVDISNENQRSVGVKSQKAWLRTWFNGSTATRIVGGSLEDFSKATGYQIEYFVPYEQLDINGKDDLDLLRMYFGFHEIEITDVISREVDYVARGANITDPSTWVRISFEK
jgi:hypothetical protein